MFTKAQERRMQRRFCLSNREMLARLSSLLREKGHRPIIDEAENLPSHCTYIARFGSLRNAYKLIGHVPEASFRYIDARRLIVSAQTEIANKLVGDIRAVGRSSIFDEKTGVLTIDGKVTISILIFRSKHERGRWQRWVTGRRIDPSYDMFVVVRMDDTNVSVLDYFLLPALEMTSPHVSLTGKNQARLDAYRIGTLDALSYAVARRSSALSRR